MKLRPFWRYYGGKWRAASKYPTPRYRTIVEPFAGAAGYATRHHDCDVMLIDKDPVIAGLWRYLIAASPDEIRALPDIKPGQTVCDLNVPQEARWLIGFWCNSGAAHPVQTQSPWNATPGYFGWGEKARERVASQVPYIKHWRVFEGDYTQAPDVEATWFVDPPYEQQGKHYRFGSQMLDFASLGAWAQSRVGQVIVCEQVGASWLPFEPFGDVKASRGVSKEVLWTA